MKLILYSCSLVHLFSCSISVGADDLFDSDFSTESFSETKVDFGSIPLETKNIGKLRLKHPAGIFLKTIHASCGCSVPTSKSVSDTETWVQVQIKAFKLGDVHSTLKIELSDGSVRVINLNGTFVSAVTASPRVVVIDAMQPVSLVFDWSATQMTKPEIMCDDDRFQVKILESGKGVSAVVICPHKPLGKGDIAFITDVGFVFSEGNRHYQLSVPVKRSRPSLIVPSTMYIAGDGKPIRFVIVTDRQSSSGRTGRCRLTSHKSEFIINGEMEKESQSSISLLIPTDWINDPKPAELDEFVLEMEFTTDQQVRWKEIGIVTVKLR